MASIEELTALVEKFREDRDWKQYHKPKSTVISLMLEAAELAEHFQWDTDEELMNVSDEKRNDIGEELSDVLYWVLLIANDFEIDLSDAFVQKMKVNEEKYPAEKVHGRSKKYNQY